MGVLLWILLGQCIARDKNWRNTCRVIRDHHGDSGGGETICFRTSVLIHIKTPMDLLHMRSLAFLRITELFEVI